MKFDTIEDAKRHLKHLRETYPKSKPAYSGGTPSKTAGIILMTAVTPLVWIAAAILAALAGGLAGLLLGLFGKALLWFPAHIPLTQNITQTYLDPFLMLIIKVFVVCVGGYGAARTIYRLTPATGRTVKEFNEEVAQIISFLSTLLLTLARRDKLHVVWCLSLRRALTANEEPVPYQHE
jgi:hypothetical protein